MNRHLLILQIMGNESMYTIVPTPCFFSIRDVQYEYIHVLYGDDF